MDTRALLSAIVVCTAVALSAATAAAQVQASGFAVNRYEPSEPGSDWFVNESLDLRGDPRPAFRAVFDWAYRPLVLYDPSNIQGNPRANVITDQIFVHAGASLVLDDRWRVGLDIPLALFQGGEDLRSLTTTTRSPEKPALGDVRLSGDIRVLGKYGAPISAAVGTQVHLPTGSRSLYTGDGTVRISPRLLVAGDFEGFLYAVKLGFGYRPWDASFLGRPLGSEAFFSAAFGVKVNDRFVFGPELFGSTVVTGGERAFRTRSTPLELLIGAHLTFLDRWRTGMAIGPGFTRGDGTPSMRVLLSLELTPDVCIDKDGDGICADEDVCPNVDGVPQNHGCPADADYDGFTDAEDACPYDPGTRTADPKTTGCPDRDSDGVADRNDACVDVAGTPTSDPATNGCPKDAVPVEKLVIAEHAGFPEGGSAINASAARVLEDVAKTMREHPQIRLRIEGHTDDREGTVSEMKALATARADAARKWLEEHGIDGGRLRSEGYGGDRLLDTTGTEAGRSKNRRVEFHAIED